MVFFIFLVTIIYVCDVKANTSYLFSCEEKRYEIIVITRYAEIHIEKDYLSKKEILEVSERIEEGIEKVKNYLGAKYLNFDFSKFKIKYFIKDGNFVSNAAPSSGIIFLSYVKQKHAPYLHETVHVLASNFANDTETWLSEGLAVYLNDYLGGYPAFANFGKDLDILSKQIINSEEFRDVVMYFPMAFIPNQNKRKAFYILAGSFVKFIENNYGKENLLEIYNNPKEINKIMNKTIEQIKNDWINYLKNL